MEADPEVLRRLAAAELAQADLQLKLDLQGALLRNLGTLKRLQKARIFLAGACTGALIPLLMTAAAFWKVRQVITG